MRHRLPDRSDLRTSRRHCDGGPQLLRIGCRACTWPALHEPSLHRARTSRGWNSSDGISPLEAIKLADFDEGTNIKCTLCAHRVDRGLEPACVVTCPTDARIFGDWEEENGKLQRLVKERKGWALLPEYETKPNVYYLDA